MPNRSADPSYLDWYEDPHIEPPGDGPAYTLAKQVAERIGTQCVHVMGGSTVYDERAAARIILGLIDEIGGE